MTFEEAGCVLSQFWGFGGSAEESKGVLHSKTNSMNARVLSWFAMPEESVVFFCIEPQDERLVSWRAAMSISSALSYKSITAVFLVLFTC